VIDHFLAAPVYGQTWLDALLTLGYAAAQTSRVKLGTAILVAPLRNPVLLAKEVATLQFLSGERLSLGVGAGWNPLEFDAVQVPRRERGRRTDDIVEILRLLLGRPSASFEGRYYRFPEVAVEPLPTAPPPIWIGGGPQLAAEGSSEPNERAAERVVRRIAASDGRIAPSTAGPELLAATWTRIRRAARELGRDPAALTFCQHQYVHVVDTADRERAYAEQRRAFAPFVGARRPWSYVERAYLVGSTDDVVCKLRERAAAGATHFILAPVTSDPRELERQLDLLTTRVLLQTG